ncbi:hypothetical protein L596_022878 [Steinernema carpocapsae]|uniref:Mitochondrial carrier protein n=1 Tax=Steinernema carpocapsae TaxID=34508 RepID=A0A4U5MBT6_STECR|nr:hypothetical protein L596_022878 [Steinernema carpocapsae]
MKSSNTKSFYSDFLPTFASGAVASAIAKTAIAPLDRTKINFQVSTSQKYSFTAALKFAKKTYRESGFFSLWRGNSAQIVRVVPSGAIQFAAHEQYVELFQVDKNGVSTPFRRFAAGSCATTTAGIITYPLDTARAQLAVSSKDEYKNLTSVFVQNYRNHGLSSFYRGLIPSLMGAMIYGGVGWFINDSLKKIYKERTGLKVTLVTSFVFGASAGLIGQVCSYPLDIVRRRTQTRRIPPGQTTAQSLMLIWRTEGVRDGLYKGFSINMIKGPLSSGYGLLRVRCY